MEVLQMTNEKQGLDGIWTPWALVFCYKCHGSRFDRGFGDVRVLADDVMEKHEKLVSPDEHEALTPCDKCGRLIVLPDSIAVEHNMALELRSLGIDAGMEQTGGMCDALGVYALDGGYYYMTYNFDGDGWYMLSKFDSEQEWIENFEAIAETYEEMLEIIKALPDLKPYVE
jgi:hypothetical protein